MNNRIYKGFEPNPSFVWVLLLTMTAPPLSSAGALSAWASESGGDAGGKEACKSKEQDEQRQQYCQAAKDSEKAAKANNSVMMIYSGVAAVCTTSCLLSFTVYATVAAEYACMASSLAGGVGDMMLTKDFMGAIGAVAGVGGGVFMKGGLVASHTAETAAAANKALLAKDPALYGPFINADGSLTGAAKAGEGLSQSAQNAGGIAQEGASKASENDWGACLSAAGAGVQAFMKKTASDDAKKTADQNYKAAAKLQAQNPTAQLTGFSPATASGEGMEGSGGSGLGGGSGITDIAASESAGGGKDPCSAPGAGGGNFQATLQCALASDKNLPPMVKDPRFARDLTKATGMSPDAFLEKVSKDGPASAMAGGTGAALTPEGVSKLGSLLAAIQDRTVNNETGYMYAGAGGGGRGRGGAEDPGFDKLFSGIMNQFGPQKGAENMPLGVKGVNFGNEPKRFPANVAEDKRVSIFERVTARYHRVSDRILP